MSFLLNYPFKSLPSFYFALLFRQNQAVGERGDERVAAASGDPAFLALSVLRLREQPRPRPPARLLPCSHVHGGRDDGRVAPREARHREAQEEGEEAEEDEVRRKDAFVMDKHIMHLSLIYIVLHLFSPLSVTVQAE